MATSIINKPQRTVAEERAGWIFSEIAGLAEAVERFGILAVAHEDGDDPRDLSAYLKAIKSLSAQIGLLSDFGSKVTGGIMQDGATVDAWLLPPVYPREDSEVTHG